MIKNGFVYLAIICFIVLILKGIYQKHSWTILKYCPLPVCLYLIMMMFCSAKIWDLQSTQWICDAASANLLYPLIFLMLLQCPVKEIMKIGPRMIGCFFIASLSIMLSFIFAYWLMKSRLPHESWRTLGALCASWLGGSGNMLAIQSILNIPEADIAVVLVVDSVFYSLWLVVLTWCASCQDSFNSLVHGKAIEHSPVKTAVQKSPVSIPSLILLLAMGISICAICQNVSNLLSVKIPWLNANTLSIILVSISGLVAGAICPSKSSEAAFLSSHLLYILIALIASRANLFEITGSLIWIALGALILCLHAASLLIFARIFRFDLSSLAISSMANIGGPACAPVVASSYSRSLIPISIFMSLIGNVIGTFGGLLCAHIMKIL